MNLENTNEQIKNKPKKRYFPKNKQTNKGDAKTNKAEPIKPVVQVKSNNKKTNKSTSEYNNLGKQIEKNVKETNTLKSTKNIQTNPKTKNNTPSKLLQKSNKDISKNDTKESTQKTKSKKYDGPAVKILFLGGLNEIGKNLTLFECGNDIIVVDCGMAFPDDTMPGIDIVLPDFTYLEKNADKVRGIVLTHGHEDHIGSLPYLLKKMNVPIYSAPLTLGLVSSKLREHGLESKTKLNVLKPGSTIKLGCMAVEAIRVNHSIPDAMGFAIFTPAGIIVHTGDFKIDTTPIQGEIMNLTRLAELGKRGVLVLLADSTNAERMGYTTSERKVGETFENLFRTAADKRIIIATFASNIHRVQQIVNCAEQHGRKVALSGRSMVNVMGIAMELGYLKVPEGLLIDINAINQYPKNKVVLITTGSQGEPMSALSRMAYSEHRQVEVGSEDFIIISATPIPGNEKTVTGVINELLKRCCKVVYESMYEVHVSGHACQEELKLVHSLLKPKFFLPVHGEQKHLIKHAELAKSMGMPESNIYVGDIGTVVELTANNMKVLPSVTAGKVFVDGSGVGDVGNIVLRDRKLLAEDGIIIIVSTIDSQDGHTISGPDVVSRGFVYVRESEQLIEEIRLHAIKILDSCSETNVREWGIIKNKLKDNISRLVYNKTKRSPMILPIIMEI